MQPYKKKILGHNMGKFDGYLAWMSASGHYSVGVV